MTVIKSKNNIKIKDLIRLRDDKKFRNDKSLFYIEGERIFKDTPKQNIKEIYIKQSKYNEYAGYIEKFNDIDTYILDDNVYDKVSDTINSQGIICVTKYSLIDKLTKEYIDTTNNIIILDAINDPGNLGTIIRLSEASKIDLIILSNNCCDLYNPKTIRSSMSSIFRTNIYISHDLKDTIATLKNNNYKIYTTEINKTSSKYTDIEYKNKTAIIFGNEAHGVSSLSHDTSDNSIYIPMCGNIQSLNVAISSAIVLYEIMRQNKFYES